MCGQVALLPEAEPALEIESWLMTESNWTGNTTSKIEIEIVEDESHAYCPFSDSQCSGKRTVPLKGNCHKK